VATEVDVSAQLTLVELAKRTNNKQTLDIAMTLAKLAPVVGDMTWVEANQLTGHVHTRDEALPSGTWRDVNEGVSPSAGQTSQITEQIGYLEDRSEIDELLVKLAPEPKQFRYNEDLLHLEGLAQTIETAIWYGDRSAYPKRINGFATRYNGLSLTPDNVATAGSAVTCTSVYIIKWGPNSVFGIYPMNSKTLGIEKNDKGLQFIHTTAPAGLFKWVTQFIFNIGLCVRDDRCVQRLANINGAASAAANLVDENKLIEMYFNIPGGHDGCVLYCNKAVASQFAIRAKDKPNVFYPSKDAFGNPVTMFWDIPIHVSEMITSSETAVA
jgi:hypothetical protein